MVEHRYYGESQPFADEWSTDNLKYLTSAQALADLNDFIILKNKEMDTKYGAAKRQWVTIGGSYPGALSAWFKKTYPEAAAVAWSSSGVIEAIQDFN